MTPICRELSAMTTLLAVCGAGAQGIPEAYTLVELEPLAGATESRAVAINNSGQIVGTSIGTTTTAAVWNASGTATALGILPGDSESDGIDVNDEGTVLMRSGTTYLFRSADGTFTTIDPPSGTNIVGVQHINALGAAVGGVFDVVSQEFGVVVWTPTPTGLVASIEFTGETLLPTRFNALADNGLLGYTTTIGVFVVDLRKDSVVGSANGKDGGLVTDIANNGLFTAVEYNTPQFVGLVGTTEIEPIGCDSSSTSVGCNVFGRVEPSALNETGLVVGTATTLAPDGKDGPRRGFIWSLESGTVGLQELVQDGSAQGWELNEFSNGPEDINDAGWIVGNGINPMGQRSAYLLIPRGPCTADTNRDGLVMPSDFNAWIIAYNNGCDG